MSKLYIYDSSSSIDRKQAAGRFVDKSVHTVAASSVADLESKLDVLVAANRTFQRVLFQTHGNAGMIFFGRDAIDPGRLRRRVPSAGGADGIGGKLQLGAISVLIHNARAREFRESIAAGPSSDMQREEWVSVTGCA